MPFRFRGLDPTPFGGLYGRSDEDLAARGVRRVVADRAGAFPDRVELRDAAPGETLLLLNHVHQPADTPYRASHAVFVREFATVRFDQVGCAPDVLRRRLVSLRAFDEGHEMIDADCIDGDRLDRAIETMFANADAAYLHAHFAKRGCYAALVERS